MTIHPLDLPNLRSEPSYTVLQASLDELYIPPPTFLAPPPAPLEQGIITWLTRLVAHPLNHLTASESEDVWARASALLSSECGRTARPSMTRTFHIPLPSVPGMGDGELGTAEIHIHEPTLTSDALGLKTWSTSFIVSRALSRVWTDLRGRVLELGSGTGLLGISVAKLYAASVTMTDYLPDIVENLHGNVALNQVSAKVAILDWRAPEESCIHDTFYDLVMASDFMYDETHATLVAAMMKRFTRKGGHVLAAYPLRTSNVDFIQDFKGAMATDAVWQEVQYGEESGYDDWGGHEETICHWHLYRHL